jgi:glycosyltransferase involved in cell wall biosynthesis
VETEGGEIIKLERLANSSGVGKQVRFVGGASTPLPFMIAADVFLLPSREDPFPLVCLESADCGVPTICFAEAGGMPDFVGSDCGVVVSHLDVQQMAAELGLLLNDETRTRRLGEQAREKVRSQFDVSVKGQDIYDILRNVCEAPAGSRFEANHVYSLG